MGLCMACPSRMGKGLEAMGGGAQELRDRCEVPIALLRVDMPEVDRQVGEQGIHLARDTLLPQLLAAMACRRCLGLGNSSICNNTLSNRSGNDRLKNRDAGVVPFAARQSKLCSTVHT
jgi:hypothetical protein